MIPPHPIPVSDLPVSVATANKGLAMSSSQPSPCLVDSQMRANEELVAVIMIAPITKMIAEACNVGLRPNRSLKSQDPRPPKKAAAWKQDVMFDDVAACSAADMVEMPKSFLKDARAIVVPN